MSDQPVHPCAMCWTSERCTSLGLPVTLRQRCRGRGRHQHDASEVSWGRGGLYGAAHTPVATPVGPVSARARERLHGLDGIRGLAALFVVFHHCWLLSFPGYPSNTGPWWLGWLVYGHFAVVIFIVLSGFSLSIAPARSRWQLRSVREFARRRAWRILPPYWAALAFSLAVAWWIVAQPGTDEPTGKSVAVYGFLVQDLFGSPSPNGAFWSIAIEAQLYLLFPLLLLVRRRWGAAVMLASITAIVVMTAALSPHESHIDKLMRLTPQFAALFTAGIVADGDPRGTRSDTSASLALAGADRGRSGRAGDRSTGVGLDRGQLRLGRSRAGSRDGVAARGGRSRQAKPFRTPAREPTAAASRRVLLQPVPHALADRGRHPPLRATARISRLGCRPSSSRSQSRFRSQSSSRCGSRRVFEIPFQRHRSWAAWRDVVSSARWRRQAPEMLGASPSASDESADVATTQAAALVPLKRERSGAADPIVGPDPDRA